ncbi:hypothetical protein [Salipiger sp. CCB-MM3]|uniref:hypothetical protein n=1 Tax=Salipiger sp. CCB-MM3 TaxID=1792508 RepID=UPI0012FAA1F0|nr:hypothetical protein [Salipiger sp. CCB-MM3]
MAHFKSFTLVIMHSFLTAIPPQASLAGNCYDYNSTEYNSPMCQNQRNADRVFEQQRREQEASRQRELNRQHDREHSINQRQGFVGAPSGDGAWIGHNWTTD